jgi:hypothetical protein
MTQYFAITNAGGRAIAFFASDINPTIPAEAFAINEDVYRTWIADPLNQRWDGSSLNNEPPSPPAPTLGDYQRALEAHVDAAAAGRSYSSAVSCASYAASTNPAWAAEAQAFIAWRDAIYVAAFSALAEFEGGEAPPTIAAFIADLPVMAWPEPLG